MSALLAAAREAAAIHKNKFVRIGYSGAPTSIKQLPRDRLTPLYINSVFNCDVEYLVEDDTGVIMWPKTWIADCLPNPTIYSIREKAWPQLDLDPVELDEYRGESIVIVESVPADVSKVALRSWLTEGIDDEDPDLAAARSQLERIHDRQSRIEKQLRDLPSTKITTNLVSAKEELELRKMRGKVLDLEKTELAEDIRELTSRFDLLKKSRELVTEPAFSLRLAETRQPLGLNVWEVRFNKDLRADRMAYIAAHKFNWSIFQLAILHDNPDVCLVGKGELKYLTDAYKEINMRSVTVSRKMHGKGMYKFPDERGVYSGRFRHGLRHGVGTEISQMGRFQCHFKNDFREGPCTAILASGDTLRCNMGGSRFHTRKSLLFGDEYADGVAHGEGSARFVDGSEYDGEFYDGVPYGQGIFRSAVGEVFEGNFGGWGSLDGYGVHTASASMKTGSFRNGLLFGEGVEVDAELGEYEGDWKYGERCGYGEYLSKLLQGKYRGWWRDGMRYGRGTLNYGNIDRDDLQLKVTAAAISAEIKLKTKISLEGRIALAHEVAAKGFSSQFDAMQASTADVGKVTYPGDYEYEGRWLGNIPRAGGLFTARQGHAQHNMHRLSQMHALRDVNAPNGFGDFDKREAAILVARQRVRAKSVKEANDICLIREAQNIVTFRYWKKLSDLGDPAVREANRKSSERKYLEKIKDQLKKITFKFADMGDSNTADDQLAMSDEAIMAALKAEDDKLAAKVALPEEVRLGYFI